MQIRTFLKQYSFNRYLSGILFLVLTLIAVARALQQYYIFDAGKLVQHSLWWHIPFNLCIWWLWLIFVPFIYWVTVRFQRLPWIVSYLLFPVCMILLRQSIAAVIIYFLRGTSTFPSILFYRTIRGPGIWVDIVVFFAIVIGIRVVEFKHQSERDSLKYTQLLARLAQSQLNALQSQLRPHFLFNTLNNLSTSIVLHENAEAKRMLSLIRNFLETTLDENNRQEITFEQELRFINQYIEIEKVRYEDKLRVEQYIPPETLPALVPRFLLLPLVENSMNYAIAPKRTDGFLGIRATQDGETLEIVVEDNGPGWNGTPAAGKSHKGVGMKNTRERLQHLYRDRFTLQYENRPQGGFQVLIRIPYRLTPSVIPLPEIVDLGEPGG